MDSENAESDLEAAIFSRVAEYETGPTAWLECGLMPWAREGEGN